MSFVLNSSQQISLFDSLGFLSQRKQRMLEKSWAKAFSDHIFVNIDEMIFAPLYSEKTNSRPNAPINVIVGALLLKEFTGLTDDEIREECEFDLRFQYALHTTSFEEQPLSDRTFSRFRERTAAYQLTTGIDLIHECMVSLAENIREFMNIDPSIKRMDSMMIESNIRKMGRLELLYTCLSNLIRMIRRDGKTDLLEGLDHYAAPNDRNRVIYHDRETPYEERLQKVIDDAVGLLPLCKDEYEGTEEYQLLERAITEQTKVDDNGNHTPKGKGEGIDSSVLQNPSDPDATYRKKAGKEHQGYAANIVEAVDENGSVVTDYQYDVNTHSDAAFISEYLDDTEAAEGTELLIADGAYSSEEIRRQAAEKGIEVHTTGLLGRKMAQILGEFTLSDDHKNVTACPEGHKPKSSSYIQQSNSIRTSFLRSQCENCPRREECGVKLKARTSLILIPVTSWTRIREKADEDPAFREFITRIRNGVETVPSIIRNKYRVDHMPVRGKLKTGQCFGFKIGALNFSKLLRYLNGEAKCRAFMPA